MANYTGDTCPVCKQIFKADDDVVVCPVCGAPHHRTCYTELGHCSLESEHGNSFEWKSERAQPQDDFQQNEQFGSAGGEAVTCPTCGTQNPPGGIFCQRCGARLVNLYAQNPYAQQAYGGFADTQPPHNAYYAAFGGVSPDEEIEGIKAQDLALFIGQNSHYYLPRFKGLANGLPVSRNTPVIILAALPTILTLMSLFGAGAFMFLQSLSAIIPVGALYFFYRKMYAPGGIITALTYISWIPSIALAPELATYFATHFEDIMNGISPPAFEPTKHLWAQALSTILPSVALVVSLMFALVSTRIYFRHTIRTVRKIQSLFADKATFDNREYTARLISCGRTAKLPVVLAICGTLMLYFAIFVPLMQEALSTIM